MSWLFAFFRALFLSRLDLAIRVASGFGRISLEQGGLGGKSLSGPLAPASGPTRGKLGWICLIRAHERPETDGFVECHPQFSWKGEGETMLEAVEDAILEALETNGGTGRILGDEFRPKLSGKRFD